MSKRFRLPREHVTKGIAGSISKLFFEPLLRHRHPYHATKDFLEGLFNMDVEFDIRMALKPFKYGGQQEITARGEAEQHKIYEARLGDVFTARINPELGFVGVEVNNVTQRFKNAPAKILRCTPGQWQQIKEKTLDKTEIDFRKGRGHDTIKRNLNKLHKLGFDTDTAARITYILAGRIKDEEY